MGRDPGYIVTTKSGKQGRTYHNKEMINGKVPVYLDGIDTPMLCDPDSLIIKGYID